MARVVSLYLPSWPTDRLRRRLGRDAPPAETPLVMIGREGRRRVVLAGDAAALRLGLHPGMAASKAQALAADLVIHDADPVGDADALERLALWALKLYAPLVAPDPPDGLVMDVSGASHLRGGEEALLREIVDRCAATGLSARAAMAATWGSAHALARYVARPTVVVAAEASGRALADLPVRALRLPPDMVEALGRLGLDRIGELEAKPRAPLALRFGPELTRRLDQAYGRVSEIISPVEAPELIGVRRAFAEPIGAPETLARYTVKLVTALCITLEAKGLGVRKLDLRFHRVDNRLEAIRVGTARPVRDIKRLSPDQPPVSFTWRGVRRRVSRADGPERIFGEWWRRDGEIEAVRDYFQIEDQDGGRYWVFRRGDGEQAATGDLSWFMHGLFG